MKVALVARSVFPIHGYGGLERHVYDLARALADRSVEVTLVTQPPTDGTGGSAVGSARAASCYRFTGITGSPPPAPPRAAARRPRPDHPRPCAGHG